MRKKYNVIYADPPWSYRNKNTGGSLISGSSAKYTVMTLDEIKSMDLPVEKDAVLFLWATVPLLPEAFEVMSAWGFNYKTMLTWRKIMSLGLGYWYRGQCEHLLFGTRGNVKAFRMQVCNFYESKAGQHSEKPPYFRELIEKSVDGFDFPVKLELFARGTATPGWDVFGNEAVNSITL